MNIWYMTVKYDKILGRLRESDGDSSPFSWSVSQFKVSVDNITSATEAFRYEIPVWKVLGFDIKALFRRNPSWLAGGFVNYVLYASSSLAPNYSIWPLNNYGSSITYSVWLTASLDVNEVVITAGTAWALPIFRDIYISIYEK